MSADDTLRLPAVPPGDRRQTGGVTGDASAGDRDRDREDGARVEADRREGAIDDRPAFLDAEPPESSWDRDAYDGAPAAPTGG